MDGHPVFQLNMRQRRWWQNGRTPARYAGEIIAWVVMILLLAWVLAVGGRYALLVRSVLNGGRWSTYQMTDDLWTVLLWCGGISIGLSYLLDFVLMAVTVGSISGEQRAHRWQLIQLTPLSGQSVVEALHRANQFRLWRVTMIVIGTRVAVTMAAILLAFVLQPVLDQLSFADAWRSFWYSPLENMYILVMLFALAAFFALEPLWRLRSATALAMAVSAQVERYVVALAQAFPMMLGLWLLRIGLAGGVFWGTIQLSEGLYDLTDYDTSMYLSLILVLGFVAVEIGLFYYSFRLVERGALRWALRQGFTLRERWQTPPKTLPWWNGLRWWLPHSGIWRGNALFTVNLAGVRWWQDARSPRRRFVWMALWVALLLLVLYVLLLVVLMIAGSYLGTTLADSIVLIGLMALGLLVWVDVRTSQAAINSVHRSRVPLGNELVQLAALHPADIVEAYRAVVRVRTWNVTAAIAVHVVVMTVLYVVNVYVMWFIDGGGWTLSGRTWEFLEEEALLVLATLVIAPAFVFVRVRAITALMLVLAVRWRGAALEAARAVVLVVLIGGQAVLFVYLLYEIVEWAAFMAGLVLLAIALLALEQGALGLARRFVRCSGR